METEAGPKQTKKLRSREVPAAKLRRPQHTELYQDGREYPDPTPVAPPVGFLKQPPLADLIKQMVRSEALKRAAMEADAETFEEADDFDVGDDYDPRSPYEEQFDPPPEGPSDQEYRDMFINDLASGLKKAFTEEAPATAPPAPASPPEAEPAAPAPAPPTDPVGSFFQRKR